MKHPFHKLEAKHKVLYAIFIGSAVVLFWRGIWGLADEVLFPENYLLSSLVSILLGLFILGVSHSIIQELK